METQVYDPLPVQSFTDFMQYLIWIGKDHINYGLHVCINFLFFLKT